MNAFHVACVGYTGPRRRYWASLDTQELTERDLAARSGTLVRWRARAPATARFVPRVDPGLVAAGFRGPAAEQAWATTLAAAETLAADIVLLRTPATFRPTRENRAALAEFFAAARPAGLAVAWWAEGIWEGQPDDRDAVCAAGGLIAVADPLADEEDDLPAGDRVYWRVRGGVGMGGRLSDHHLDRLLELAGARRGGDVVFVAPTMMNEARRFGQLLGLASDAGDHEDEGDDEDDGEDDGDA